MNYQNTTVVRYKVLRKGFVLPFTLFVVSLMLLISTSISTMLIKQLYFARTSRLSQVAYYAADNAIACTILVDDTYIDNTSFGVFPYDPSADMTNYMSDKLAAVNLQRDTDGLPDLSSWDDVECARSTIFKVGAPNNFEIKSTPFTRNLPAGGTEDGRTSTFKMKMNLNGTDYRCATVTVNKTATYRQIIAQGYALCDKPDGTIERAVINTTVSE